MEKMGGILMKYSKLKDEYLKEESFWHVTSKGNLKSIEENIVLRKCESGDFIHIKSGRKAVKKLFTDEKIPLSLRHEHVAVAIGSEILWIFRVGNIFGEEVGLDRNGELYRIDENTKSILIMEVSRRYI